MWFRQRPIDEQGKAEQSSDRCAVERCLRTPFFGGEAEDGASEARRKLECQ